MQKKFVLKWAAVLGVFAFVTPTPAQRPLGVDVSDYQGSGINWTSAKNSGVEFAWTKATEGASGQYVSQTSFTINENNGKSAGVFMGAYHFAHPNQNSPSAEDSFFWGVAGGYLAADGKTLMPMLDMEVFSGVTGASSYSSWANDWCADVVSDAAGAGVAIRPFVYSSACSFSHFDSSISGLYSDIADYNGENAQTGTPWSVCAGDDVWGSGVWDVWQCSSTAAVPGISGNVDLDVYNGSSSGLASTLLATSARPNTKPILLTLGNGANWGFYISQVDGSVQTFSQTAQGGSWANSGEVGTGSGFDSISGVVLSSGCMAVAGCGGQAIYVSSQSTPGGNFSGWTSLGGVGFQVVKVIAFQDGHMGVAGCGGGPIFYQEQSLPGGSWPGVWTSLGGAGFTEVDAVVTPNQDVTIFGCGGGAVYGTSRAPGGTFQALSSIGGNGFKTIKVLTFSNGQMALAGCGGGSLFYQQENSPGGSWPAAWTSLGGAGFTEVDAVVTPNQDVTVFGCGGGAVIGASRAPGGNFQTLSSIGGNGFERISLTALPDGTMALVGCASGESLWFQAENSPGGSWPDAWTDLGGTVK